jgi:hypothetical protein
MDILVPNGFKIRNNKQFVCFCLLVVAPKTTCKKKWGENANQGNISKEQPRGEQQEERGGGKCTFKKSRGVSK